jgi:hypothetical protein
VGAFYVYVTCEEVEKSWKPGDLYVPMTLYYWRTRWETIRVRYPGFWNNVSYYLHTFIQYWNHCFRCICNFWRISCMISSRHLVVETWFCNLACGNLVLESWRWNHDLGLSWASLGSHGMLCGNLWMLSDTLWGCLGCHRDARVLITCGGKPVQNHCVFVFILRSDQKS